jgi:Holliday junction resolvase RusA-like endonuclease
MRSGCHPERIVLSTGPGMDELILELPLPPSANHRYIRRQDGQLALTREARDYDALVWAALGRDRPRIPPRTPVSIAVRVMLDRRRRRDLDNVLKQLLDSLGRCLGFDDTWVDHIEAEKLIAPGEPCVIVRVRWERTCE